MYLQSSDDVKETRIPMDLQVHREQATTHAGASVYLCRHEKCVGTAYFAQNLASLYSHVRIKHLGIVLACPYCQNKVYWNSCGWKDHMTSHHHNVPHYGLTLIDEAQEAHNMFSAQETKEQIDVPLDPPATLPPTAAESAEDTSSDSSASSSSEEEVPVQHIKEGAYTVRHPPTLEALKKHKSSFKQPGPHTVAVGDLSENPPATQHLAEAIVLADLPPQQEINPLADMLELEEFPP